MVKNLLAEILVKREPQPFDTKGLVAAIEGGYISERKPEFKKKKSFSPSNLVWGSGACPRYWHLAFQGAVFAGDGDANPKSIASMSNGTASHARLQKAMANAGVLKADEIKIVKQDPPIWGYCDAIIEWEGLELPAEIKTMREEAFAYRKTSGKPADYHLAQLLIYMYELESELGVMIYESKNTHEILAIPVVMTPENKQWVETTYAWMQEVYGSRDKLAKKPYRANSKVCKECPLRDVCKAAPAGVSDIKPLVMLGE